MLESLEPVPHARSGTVRGNSRASNRLRGGAASPSGSRHLGPVLPTSTTTGFYRRTSRLTCRRRTATDAGTLRQPQALGSSDGRLVRVASASVQLPAELRHRSAARFLARRRPERRHPDRSVFRIRETRAVCERRLRPDPRAVGVVVATSGAGGDRAVVWHWRCRPSDLGRGPAARPGCCCCCSDSRCSSGSPARPTACRAWATHPPTASATTSTASSASTTSMVPSRSSRRSSRPSGWSLRLLLVSEGVARRLAALPVSSS